MNEKVGGLHSPSRSAAALENQQCLIARVSGRLRTCKGQGRRIYLSRMLFHKSTESAGPCGVNLHSFCEQYTARSRSLHDEWFANTSN